MDAYDPLWCGQLGNEKKTHPKCFGKFTSTSDLNIVALAADLNSPVCIISADHPIALALW